MAWPCLASHSCALGAQGPCQQPEPVFAYHKAWRRPAGFYFAWGCFSKNEIHAGLFSAEDGRQKTENGQVRTLRALLLPLPLAGRGRGAVARADDWLVRSDSP